MMLADHLQLEKRSRYKQQLERMLWRGMKHLRELQDKPMRGYLSEFADAVIKGRDPERAEEQSEANPEPGGDGNSCDDNDLNAGSSPTDIDKSESESTLDCDMAVPAVPAAPKTKQSAFQTLLARTENPCHRGATGNKSGQIHTRPRPSTVVVHLCRDPFPGSIPEAAALSFAPQG
jgi:hypothetical protein